MKLFLTSTACAFCLAATALADDFVVSSPSGLLNGGNIINDDDSLTITPTGSVIVTFPTLSAVGGIVNGFTVDNQGQIQGIGAVGIAVLGDNTVVTNSGTNTADFATIFITGDNASVNNTATGSLTAGDEGVLIDGAGAFINNSGTVFAPTGGLIALGPDAKITNSGTVTVTILDGLVIVGGNSSVSNSGTVNAFLDGIFVRGANNVIANSGTINADEDGIDSEGPGGDVITNTGTIFAARDGIEANGDNVTINNFGRVVATSDAFDLNGANSVLNLFHGSNIEGLLSFDGATGVLNYGPGINAALTDDGGAPANVTAPNGATFTVGNVHYAINSDQFRVTRDRFNNLLPQFQNIAWQAHGRSPVDNTTFGFGVPLSDKARIWARLGGSFADRGASSSSAGYETTAGYLIAGIAVADDVGAFIAYDHSRSELENSFGTTNQAFIGSLYGTADQGEYAMDWSVTGAFVSGDHERTVLNNTIIGGIETAQGDNESFVISPAVGFRSHLADDQQTNLDFRYVGIFADGYTERGITSPMSFSDQQSHSFVVTPSVDWSVGDDDKPIQITLGTELRYHWGDELTASFSSGSARFSPSEENFEARGFARVWFEHELDNGWLMSSNGEFGLSTTEQVDFSATFGLRKVF